MSYGNRIIFGALGGLTLLAGHQQQTYGQERQAANQQPAASPEPAASSPFRAYSERYSDACYYADDYNAADLCAQWRAAVAAEKAADEARLATIASVVGTILTLATVIGLIITILQTNGALAEARRGNRLNLQFERRARRESRKAEADQNRALEIAERNAGAAIQAAQAAGESNLIAQSSDRAWLWRDQILTANIKNGTISGEGGKTVQVRNGYQFLVSWKNFGKNPAIIKNAYIEHTIIEFQGEIPEHALRKRPGEMVLVSGESVTLLPVFLDDRQAEDFRQGKIQVVIYTGVDYFDFDTPNDVENLRRSRFCSIGTHHRGKIEIQGVESEHISFGPTGKFTMIG